MTAISAVQATVAITRLVVHSHTLLVRVKEHFYVKGMSAAALAFGVGFGFRMLFKVSAG